MSFKTERESQMLIGKDIWPRTFKHPYGQERTEGDDPSPHAATT
jgi:hypothetical protein